MNGIEVNRKKCKEPIKRKEKVFLTEDLDRKGKISNMQSQINRTPFFTREDSNSKLVADLKRLKGESKEER